MIAMYIKKIEQRGALNIQLFIRIKKPKIVSPPHYYGKTVTELFKKYMMTKHSYALIYGDLH